VSSDLPANGHTGERSFVPALTRSSISDLRGMARLACDSTVAVTGIVEHMHGTIRRLPLPFGRPASPPDAGAAKVVYAAIRLVTGLVGKGVDTALQPLAGLGQEREDPALRAQLLAVVNGICGDHLASTGNPLATGMALRGPEIAAAGRAGEPRKLLVLVHGLCMHDGQWLRNGHDHGAALARDLGYTPYYLRYNSGLGVEENGRLFSAELERLVARQGQPGAELAIIGFSLGGLVSRSTCAQASSLQHRWPQQLRQLVFLGTPHHGAPLEAVGNGLDQVLQSSPYLAAFSRLGLARSKGIQDLRKGLSDHPAALPPEPACFAAAASLAASPGALSDALVGDGLVPVASALGQHRSASKNLVIPAQRQWLGYGLGHLDLLSDQQLYAQLSRWLA
jgi:hypothetical protein